MTFLRKCKQCGEVLKFEIKNAREVKPCFCKKCRKYKEMKDTDDVTLYVGGIK